MKNENIDINNYFGEESEIQFYDTAFPSLATQNSPDGLTDISYKSIQFSNDMTELSLINSQKPTKFVQFITDVKLWYLLLKPPITIDSDICHSLRGETIFGNGFNEIEETAVGYLCQ